MSSSQPRTPPFLWNQQSLQRRCKGSEGPPQANAATTGKCCPWHGWLCLSVRHDSHQVLLLGQYHVYQDTRRLDSSHTVTGKWLHQSFWVRCDYLITGFLNLLSSLLRHRNLWHTLTQQLPIYLSQPGPGFSVQINSGIKEFDYIQFNESKLYVDTSLF